MTRREGGSCIGSGLLFASLLFDGVLKGFIKGGREASTSTGEWGDRESGGVGMGMSRGRGARRANFWRRMRNWRS